MKDIDHRADVDDWMAMWGEMDKGGIHPQPEAPKPFPALNPRDQAMMSDDPADMYFAYAQEVLTEERNQKLVNSVPLDTLGPDSETTPPVWNNEELLKSVESLKNQLFKIENKLASKMGGDGKWIEKPYEANDQKLWNEIEALKKRINKVSDNLGIREDEFCWKVNK